MHNDTHIFIYKNTPETLRKSAFDSIHMFIPFPNI